MGLKVIGAGFGRTGTRSLKTAPERLGCGARYIVCAYIFVGPCICSVIGD
jgi:hypothetical protein